ncbi:MAG: septal ring lytic transglycosylase RlpA family protein [Deltaproteobacteria bacterium]|nr:septal ring lytic transglycosylase RlpA family protein [Deltaproteobacteria bacterium]
MKNRILFLFIISLIMTSCSGIDYYLEGSRPVSSKTSDDYYIVNGERYYPLPDSLGFIETGKASWYGEDFHGRPTASGEIYDMYKKTAAHKTLPLGTYVKVINLENNESTIVRINDRGPFVKDRIIDLSYGAAKEIDMDVAGLAYVQVIAFGKEADKLPDGSAPVLDLADFETGDFTVQVGAFTDKNSALILAEQLKANFDYVNIMEYIDKENRIFFRVHVSKSTTLIRAEEFKMRLENMGFSDAFILRL